jgi:hypothetical protein
MGLRARTEGEGSVVGITLITERVLLYIYIYGQGVRHVWVAGEVRAGFGGEIGVKENAWKT